MQMIAIKRPRLCPVGAPSKVAIGLPVSWLGGGGKREYRDGRHPVAPVQQGPAVRARRGLAAPAAWHIRILPHARPSARRRCAGVYVRAGPEAAPARDLKPAQRSVARSPRRGGRGRHWRDAAAATAAPSADAALLPPRRAPDESRLARASAGPRT